MSPFWPAPEERGFVYARFMSTHSALQPPIHVFISYVRADDEGLGLVRPLKENLSQLITAVSGRPAEIFIDRDNISYGENWSEKIQNAVRHSYFFIPIYTRSYLQSEACREEFILFRKAAAERQVSNLIIPIIWFDMESLRPEGEDDISDYIRDHQSVLFKDAWIEGVDSPAYRRTLAKIAERIIEVAPRADDALAAAEAVDAGQVVSSSKVVAAASSSDTNDPNLLSVPAATEIPPLEDDDLLELSTSVEEEMSRATLSAGELSVAIKGLGNIPQPPAGNSSPKDLAVYMLRVAEALRGPAQVIEKQGYEMFDAVKKTDSYLERIVSLTRASKSPDLIGNIHNSLSEGIASLAEVQVVGDQLQDLLDAFSAPEALSASVRRAIKPARQGIAAVQDSITLMADWPAAIDDLHNQSEPSE